MYVNMLSHPISIKTFNGDILDFGSGLVNPRIRGEEKNVDDTMIYTIVDEYIENLPPEQEGVKLIVSLFVAQLVSKLYPTRRDILSPGKKVFGVDGKMSHANGLRKI